MLYKLRENGQKRLNAVFGENRNKILSQNGSVRKMMTENSNFSEKWDF